MKLDHIGIAVKDMVGSETLFNNLLGIKPYKREHVLSQNVATTFYKTGESKIELLQSHDPENVISKFIDSKGEGIHHVAFIVPDIEAEIQRLQAAGFHVLGGISHIGADNKLVCFVHPKSANGVLVELCQHHRTDQ